MLEASLKEAMETLPEVMSGSLGREDAGTPDGAVAASLAAGGVSADVEEDKATVVVLTVLSSSDGLTSLTRYSSGNTK